MALNQSHNAGAAQERRSSTLFIVLGLICMFIIPPVIVIGAAFATHTPTPKSVLANTDSTYEIEKDSWVGMAAVENAYYDSCDVTKDGKTSTFTDKDYGNDRGVVFHVEEAGKYKIECNDTHSKDKYAPAAIMTGEKKAFIHPVADFLAPAGLVLAGISFLAGIGLIIVGILRWRKNRQIPMVDNTQR